MKCIRIIKLVLANLCIICSIALLVICILDWYNPYMNFLGNSLWLLYLLCVCSAVFGILELAVGRNEKYRNEKHRNRRPLRKRV